MCKISLSPTVGHKTAYIPKLNKRHIWYLLATGHGTLCCYCWVLSVPFIFLPTSIYSMCCMKFTFPEFCIQIAITISPKGRARSLCFSWCRVVWLCVRRNKAFGSSRMCSSDFCLCSCQWNWQSLQFCENGHALCPICIRRHLNLIPAEIQFTQAAPQNFGLNYQCS